MAVAEEPVQISVEPLRSHWMLELMFPCWASSAHPVREKLWPAVIADPLVGDPMLTVGAVFAGACTTMFRTTLAEFPCESFTVATI